MSEIIITVRGTARRELQPDRVTVHLAIDCESPERAAAQERAVQAVDSVTAALDARHHTETGPVLRWSLDQLALTAQRPWTPDGAQAPLSHRAHLRGTAELAVGGVGTAAAKSLAALAALVDELSVNDAVMIENLSWRLTDSHRSSAETEVRSRAVKDAVTTATVYAQSQASARSLPSPSLTPACSATRARAAHRSPHSSGR